MSTSAHYQGDRGVAYHESQHAISPETRAKLDGQKLAKHLPAAVDRLLDFGCGNGAILATLPANERIGVDAIRENRLAATERGIDAHATLDDIPAKSIDVAVSNHALEHTLDPVGSLKAIRRVLKPDGKFVIYVPADDWRNERAYDPNDRNHHLFTWTPLSLGHLLSEAGFHVLHVTVNRRAWPGRLTDPLASRLPPATFDRVMALTSRLRHRCELVAVAGP